METQKFESDKIYSTYWWLIKLDHNHPHNNNIKVAEITGYSKRTGHDEAKNKTELLMNKIIMLYSRGYFEKSISITLHMKKGDLLNKSNSRDLIKMTRSEYFISSDCTSDKNFYQEFMIKGGVIRFLKQFYDCIANGKDVKYLMPNTRPTFSKDDYLNIEKQSFKTRAHLYSYCEKLIRNGHPYEAVMRFQFKIEEREKGKWDIK